MAWQAGTRSLRRVRPAADTIPLRPEDSLSENAFFHVIDIEEELHFAWWLTKLRNVLLEILLHLFGQIAEPQTAHFVIPPNDRFRILLRRILADPVVDLVISRAGCDELLELGRFESGELPKIRAEPARIEVIFAIDAEQIGTGFVEHPCRDDEATECFARTAGWRCS